MSVARYPFSLTVHLKNGSQLLLDRAIHLNGEWEMCITQLCIPKSQITLFRDCFKTFNYDLQPKTPAKTERDLLWNAKLRKLSLREKQRSIRVTLPAGSYDNKAIMHQSIPSANIPLGNPRGFAPIFIPDPRDLCRLDCPGVARGSDLLSKYQVVS